MNKSRTPVILASQSPRRVELLKQIIKNFLVIPSEVDEVCSSNLSPEKNAMVLAQEPSKTQGSGTGNPEEPLGEAKEHPMTPHTAPMTPQGPPGHVSARPVRLPGSGCKRWDSKHGWCVGVGFGVKCVGFSDEMLTIIWICMESYTFHQFHPAPKHHQ